MEKIKVCVADDNRELVSLLSEYIEGQDDMEVIGVAYNGQECLSLFKDKNPDVLVLDIIMPHLDGLAVFGASAGIRAREAAERHHADGIRSGRRYEKSRRFRRVLFHPEAV